MTINLKVDTSGLKALIAAEIAKQDALAQKCATQMMMEGVNVAQTLVRKDTGNLKDSIASDSSVTRISPCIFSIELKSNMEYASHQEMGPQSGKRVWRFSPFIRPAAAIVQSIGPEIIDRVYN